MELDREQPGDKQESFRVNRMTFKAGQTYIDDAGKSFVVTSASSSIATCPCGDILAIQEKKCDRADCPVVAKSPSAIERSQVLHLLAVFRRARRHIEYRGAFTPHTEMLRQMDLQLEIFKGFDGLGPDVHDDISSAVEKRSPTQNGDSK